MSVCGWVRKRLVVERCVDTASSYIESNLFENNNWNNSKVEDVEKGSDRYIFGMIPVRVRFVVGYDIDTFLNLVMLLRSIR